MDKKIYDQYLNVLNEELVTALGCTEPIAVAYASALAKDQLGCDPSHITVYCSGNIIKNVKGVTVPNSGGQKGVEIAAILGAIGGDSDKKLEVLTTVTQEHIDASKKLLKDKLCKVELVEGVANLYIRVEMESANDSSCVEISDKHTNVVRISKNGKDIMSKDFVMDDGKNNHKRDFMSVAGIYEFAKDVNIDDVKDLLSNQVKCNMAIAEEGLTNPWGANVGKNIFRLYGKDRVETRAKAYAAAGSDARMSGCDMAVVINSGSGNQGITVTTPVVQYAQALEKSEEELYRALCISNLVAVHIKTGIGSLSAFCGAVSAATGAGAGITYLKGGSLKQIEYTITNTLGTISGMVCDGAKSSCAEKIASAVETAIISEEMSENEDVFKSDEGILGEDIELTIKNIGRMGRKGMADTDIEILNIMIGN